MSSARTSPRSSEGNTTIAADLHPHFTDAPTVALRVPPPEQQCPTPRKSRAPLVVILATAAMIAAILLLAVVLQEPTPAPVPAAPAPVAAPVEQLSQTVRIDATLAGLNSGLELRRTWGANLTRQTAASACNGRATIAYPSRPDALLVFARSCEATANR